MDYIKECPNPIPIGQQKYAYQCENVSLEPIHGALSIRGYKPHKGGKEPYPNSEADIVEHYQLEIERHTGNAINLCLTKKFKDGSESLFFTTVSFSDLVNRLFQGNPANVWEKPAPFKPYIQEEK